MQKKETPLDDERRLFLFTEQKKIQEKVLPLSPYFPYIFIFWSVLSIFLPIFLSILGIRTLSIA